MPTQTPPVQSTTIRKFLKENTQMRVSIEATDQMVDLLTTTSEKIASQASQEALYE